MSRSRSGWIPEGLPRTSNSKFKGTKPDMPHWHTGTDPAYVPIRPFPHLIKVLERRSKVANVRCEGNCAFMSAVSHITRTELRLKGTHNQSWISQNPVAQLVSFSNSITPPADLRSIFNCSGFSEPQGRQPCPSAP